MKPQAKFQTKLTEQQWVKLYTIYKLQRANQGFTLVTAILLGIGLFGLLIAYFAVSKVQSVTTTSSKDSSTGFYVAETGLNMRAKSIIDVFEANNGRGRPTGIPPASIAACTDIDTTNNGSGNFACVNYNISPNITDLTATQQQAALTDKVGRVAATYMVDTTRYTGTGANQTVELTQIPPDEPFAGLNAQQFTYQLNSVARKMTDTPQTEAVLTMDLKSRVVPMFQFAAFYNNDLEILPGPSMTLSGPVHTNSDLYLGADNTLTVQGAVTVVGRRGANNAVVGGIYNSRKNNGATYPDGRVRINNAANNPINLLSGAGFAAPLNTILNTLANTPTIRTTWGNRISIGINRLTLPSPGLLSNVGDYYCNGDLRISYTPNLAVPMEISRVDQTTRSSACPDPDTATPPATNGATSNALLEGPRRSLLQPVLGDTTVSAAKGTVAPDPSATTNPTWGALTSAQQTQVNNLNVAQKAALIANLRTAISSGINSIPLSYMEGINIKQTNLTSIPRIEPSSANTANPTLAGVDSSLFAATDTFSASSGGGTIDTTLRGANFTSWSTTNKGTLKAALRALSPNAFYQLILRDLNATQKGEIVRALQTAILSQSNPIAFSLTNDALNRSGLAALDTVYSGGDTYSSATASTSTIYLDRLMVLTSFSSFTDDTQKTAVKTALRSLTPAQIAALGGRAWFPAAFMDVGSSNPTAYYNDREAEDMRLLQVNLRSLTIWNRDGVYLNYNSGAVTDTFTTQITNITSNTLASGNQLLFTLAPADSGAPDNSFQRLGYAGTDATDGGYVVHMTIDSGTYTTAAGTTTTPGNSPYGFVLSQGNDLFGLSSTTTTPDATGITFASDQAIYLQGDFNNFNKQPAATLSDTLNVLSNACTTADIRISKASGINCNRLGSTLTQAATSTNTTLRVLNVSNFAVNDQVTVGNDSTSNTITAIDAANSTITLSSMLGTNQVVGSPVVKKSDATGTTINAAFLAGTDITGTGSYNGGLENYPRFNEDWGGQTLTYRGSFVSLGTPLKVTGTWNTQNAGNYDPPSRNWGYDVSFNNADNLPPLDPRFVYLKQDTFVRSFEQ